MNRLDDETEEKIFNVANSKTSDFVTLCKIAEIDPKIDLIGSNLQNIDLRGADLRGFDFSFSDLRGAMIDSKTILPDISQFEGALVDFVELEEREPIVNLMQKIETSSPLSRKSLLQVLTQEYDSQDHIDSFIAQMVQKAKTAREVATLLPFLSEHGFVQHGRSLFPKVSDVLEREAQRSPPRKKVGAVDNWTVIRQILDTLSVLDWPELGARIKAHRNGAMSIYDVTATLNDPRKH